MDITKAKKVFELKRDDRKILVTLWEGDKISSCVEEENTQKCESCEGNEELCQEYINHLKEQGYEAREVALGELELEESLPRFLERRVDLTPSQLEDTISSVPSKEREVKVEEPVVEE